MGVECRMSQGAEVKVDEQRRIEPAQAGMPGGRHNLGPDLP
jgi:hypothetical protein